MSAPLRREVLRIAEEVTAGLDDLARVTSRALAREVSRAAVVRAAVSAWLDGVESGPLGVVAEAIRAAAQRSSARLRRTPQRWSAALVARLDRIALAFEVSRSAVVRVAVAAWLATALASPKIATEAIRAALVPRGRKRASA